MKKREADPGEYAPFRMIRGFFLALAVLSWILTACSPSPAGTATAVSIPSPVAVSPSPSPSPVPTPAATATPEPGGVASPAPACLDTPGRVESGSLDTGGLLIVPLRYQVRLPPCYDDAGDARYPVLVLFHGQTYDESQWLRLGAGEIADRLAREGAPLILVLPYDRFARQPDEFPLDRAVAEALLPHIDSTYRTRPERAARAVGGLSRGAGWAIRLGLTRPDLFGAIGAHSPVILSADGPLVDDWLRDLPPGLAPRITIDSTESDAGLKEARWFESLLTEAGLPHEWHLYTGYHDEGYWAAHVEEYLRWYAAGW